MTVKDYLRQVSRFSTVIRHKRERLEELRSTIEYKGVTYGDDPFTPGDPATSRSNALAKLCSCAEELQKAIDDMNVQKQKAMDMIDSLPDSTMIDIFYGRYINGKSWDEIAYEAGRSLQSIFRLHGNGLQYLSDHYCVDQA